MGDIRSLTGAQKVTSLIADYFSLRERYPHERIKVLVESAKRFTPPFLPPELLKDILNIDKMRHMAEQIMGNIAAREEEFLGLAVAELIIKFGIVEQNRFHPILADFLMNQLWGLDVAPLTEPEGMAYLVAKLKEYGGNEEYSAELIFCQHCHKQELHIANKKGRESRQELHETIHQAVQEALAEILPEEDFPTENFPESFVGFLAKKRGSQLSD